MNTIAKNTVGSSSNNNDTGETVMKHQPTTSVRNIHSVIASLSALMVLLSLVLTVRASVIDTTGVSFDLNHADTWEDGIVPGSIDTANFIHGGTYTGSGPFDFYGMTFNAAVGIDPTVSMTINLRAGGLGGTYGVTKLGSSSTTLNLANDQTWSVASENTVAVITGTATVELTAKPGFNPLGQWKSNFTWLRGDNSGFTGTWKVNGSTLSIYEGDNRIGGNDVKVQLLDGGRLVMGASWNVVHTRGSIDLLGNGGIIVNNWAANTTANTTQPVSGTGDLTLSVLYGNQDITSTLNLAGTYTHTGDTLVKGSGFAAKPFTVNLTENSSMTFMIGANGVNNAILDDSGATYNALTLDGTFVFDLTNAQAAEGNSWTIVGSGFDSLAYGDNFTVDGFTGTDNVWTMEQGYNTWTFTEATGMLTVAIPEPASLLLLLIGGTAMLGLRRRGN